MGSVRILPCPFCGSREVRVSETTDSHFFVSCDRCEASGPLTTCASDAVWVWNAAARLRPECRSGDCRAATYDIEGAENDPSCAESGESGRNRDAECRKSRVRREPTDSWERLSADLMDASEKSEGFVCAYYGHHDGETCAYCPIFDFDGECEARFALDLIDRINRLREADHD